MRLGEILVRNGKLDAGQIEAALAAQSRLADRPLLGALLVAEGILTEGDVLEALAEQFGLSCLTSISENHLAPDLVERLPVEWARQQGALPLRLPEGVRVALSDPLKLAALDDLALLLGCDVEAVLAPRAVIAAAIERCYVRRAEGRTAAAGVPAQAARVERPREGAEDLLRESAQAPVTGLLNAILIEAVRQQASDVHLEPFERGLQVRFRVDGFLYQQPSPPREVEDSLVSRLKVMARLDIAERRLPQDGMAKIRAGDRELDVRVSTVPVAEGERVVLRLLNRESLFLPLSSLGMPGDVQGMFRSLLQAPHGMVLVTGPTGSGKTTTLYAALRELDTARLNVMTIEDPIEYQIEGIGQMQVRPKIGLTFAQGLRHLLRQDPDVLFVGEIRDTETAEIAVRAALTGHLVLSTLHTNDALSAVVRLLDMGIPPYLAGSALLGSMAQRLVRRLCPHCRTASKMDEREARFFGVAAPDPVWRAGPGCGACLGGYRGRTGLYELLTLDGAFREAIRAGRDASALSAMADAKGFRSMRTMALACVRDGVTSPDEVLRVLGGGMAGAA